MALFLRWKMQVTDLQRKEQATVVPNSITIINISYTRTTVSAHPAVSLDLYRIVPGKILNFLVA
jgi:hypothetical protein